MDSDWLFIGAVIVIMLYMTGYRAYAIVAGLLIAVIFVFSAIFERQPQKAGSSSNVLEPIVIESTRGLAYRIPGTIDIMYDRKMKEGAQWEKTHKKWGTALGKVIRKARGDKEEE
jgi:regulator of protease activity HflC (stomatin/prohibitin superfamily)